MSEPLAFDRPWKEILDAYLAEFFALVDWLLWLPDALTSYS